MSDEGYIKLKVSELKEKIDLFEAELDSSLLTAKYLLDSLQKKENEIRELNNARENLYTNLVENTKKVHERIVESVFNSMKPLLVQIKDDLNYRCADGCTISTLAVLFLIKKGMLDKEFEQFANDTFDKTMNELIIAWKKGDRKSIRSKLEYKYS